LTYHDSCGEADTNDKQGAEKVNVGWHSYYISNIRKQVQIMEEDVLDSNDIEDGLGT